MKVYISGPITGVEGYLKHFIEAEHEIRSMGHTAVNPAMLCTVMPPETTHAEYMEVDLVLLKQCDAIYMLEGWMNSKGCGEEIAFACAHEIPVFFEGAKYE